MIKMTFLLCVNVNVHHHLELKCNSEKLFDRLNKLYFQGICCFYDAYEMQKLKI